jgi:hypothetical protein
MSRRPGVPDLGLVFGGGGASQVTGDGELQEGAPYALGMAERLRRDHGLHHEPANIFSVPTSRLGDAPSG